MREASTSTASTRSPRSPRISAHRTSCAVEVEALAHEALLLSIEGASRRSTCRRGPSRAATAPRGCARKVRFGIGAVASVGVPALLVVRYLARCDDDADRAALAPAELIALLEPSRSALPSRSGR